MARRKRQWTPGGAATLAEPDQDLLRELTRVQRGQLDIIESALFRLRYPRALAFRDQRDPVELLDAARVATQEALQLLWAMEAAAGLILDDGRRDDEPAPVEGGAS